MADISQATAYGQPVQAETRLCVRCCAIWREGAEYEPSLAPIRISLIQEGDHPAVLATLR
jgi:hypothetical protein